MSEALAAGEVRSIFTECLISLNSKTDRKPLIRTVCSSEFQTHGTENQKACLQDGKQMEKAYEDRDVP